MQSTITAKIMSFDFNDINPISKAQATYKDGGGLGGGGMYMRQKGKRKEQPDDDIFERKDDKDDNEIEFSKELNEEDIPQENMFNKFVNWFRINRG